MSNDSVIHHSLYPMDLWQDVLVEDIRTMVTKQYLDPLSGILLSLTSKENYRRYRPWIPTELKDMDLGMCVAEDQAMYLRMLIIRYGTKQLLSKYGSRSTLEQDNKGLAYAAYTGNRDAYTYIAFERSITSFLYTFTHLKVDPFEMAARGGQLEFLQWLLQKAPIVNSRILKNSEYILWAFESGNLKLVQWFQEEIGCQLTANIHLFSGFIEVLKMGDIEMFEWLRRAHPKMGNSIPPHAFHYLCSIGDIAIVKHCIEHGYYDTVTHPEGISSAIRSYNLALIQYLHEKQGMVLPEYAVEEEFIYAEDMRIGDPCFQTINYLIDKGCVMTHLTFWQAANHCSIDILKWLVDEKHCPCIPTQDFFKLCHPRASCTLEGVEWFLSHGFDPQAVAQWVLRYGPFDAWLFLERKGHLPHKANGHSIFLNKHVTLEHLDWLLDHGCETSPLGGEESPFSRRYYPIITDTVSDKERLKGFEKRGLYKPLTILERTRTALEMPLSGFPFDSPAWTFIVWIVLILFLFSMY